MVPTLPNPYSGAPRRVETGWTDAQVMIAVAVCVISIAALAALLAAADAHLALGPGLPAIAYFLAGICLTMVLVNYLITLVPDTIRAGLYLSAFWAVTILALLFALKLFG